MASLGWGADRPGCNFLRLNLPRTLQGQTMIWKAERVGVVTMT